MTYSVRHPKACGAVTRTCDWTELPDVVREAVHRHVGPISETIPARNAQSCTFAATLLRDARVPVFLKSVRGVSPEMRWLRNEVETAALASGLAPRVLFHEDVDDWLIVGFEHVTGRPAVLAPASPDLLTVAGALDRIGAIEAPCLRPLGDRWRSRWWQHLAATRPDVLENHDVDELIAWETRAPELVAGSRLVHTDLHGDQFLLGDGGRVHVVDWGWPASGAPWLDPAFMVVRLITAGHTAASAEAWASAHTCWASAPPESVTAFAVYIAGLWTGKAAAEPLARPARDYARWRLASTR